jgi:hypothetical protein
LVVENVNAELTGTGSAPGEHRPVGAAREAVEATGCHVDRLKLVRELR